MFENALNDLWVERYLIAGVLGAALSVLAFIPYIRGILLGGTRPDRACWLVWAVLATMSGASNVYEGAVTSLWFVGAQVLGTLLVFVLSIRWGSGNIMSAGSLWVLGVAVLGIVSWLMMETAAVALALSIGVSALGGARTVWKSYVAPDTEARGAWVLLLASAGFGVLSVGSVDALLIAYPLYLLGLYGAIVIAGIFGRAVQAEEAEALAWAARRQTVPPMRRVAFDAAAPTVRRRRRFKHTAIGAPRRIAA